MTDHTNTVYAKNKTELPWQIESGIECDENQIGQLCDWSYRCGLHQKQDLATMIDLKQVRSRAKTR